MVGTKTVGPERKLGRGRKLWEPETHPGFFKKKKKATFKHFLIHDNNLKRYTNYARFSIFKTLSLTVVRLLNML